jgi:hypothetical protein
VRDATGQPDTPTRQKTELFAAHPKDEFTRKNVIPLLFAMMNMQEWSRTWQCVEFQDRTRPSAIFACYLAGRCLGLCGACKCEAVFASLSYGNFAVRSCPSW